MSRSSQLVREHILDFDNDFERTLRRKRNQQESNPPSPDPMLEEEEVDEQKEATARVFEEVQNMAAIIEPSKSFLLRVWTMQCLYASNTPRQPKGRQKSSN
ncbi:hypothetical protein ACFX13_047759 [Malus domestica]